MQFLSFICVIEALLTAYMQKQDQFSVEEMLITYNQSKKVIPC